MEWIIENWQTIAALGVVAATAVVFAAGMVRRHKRDGCGADCCCRRAVESRRD